MDQTIWTTDRSHCRVEFGAAAFLCVLGLLTSGCAESKNTDPGEGAHYPTIVDALVIAAPELPSPETAPYRDCLVTLQCTVKRSISGDAPEGKTFLATTWAFRDRIAQPGQDMSDGALLRFTLEPLDLDSKGLGTTMRVDETDTFDQPEFWVQSMAVVKPGTHVHVEPPVYGSPLEELAPLNRKLVEQGEEFVIGQEGFCFGMPTREIYRKGFWQLPETADDGATGSFRIVLDFHQQLAAKGIPLLFVVVPRASTIFADLATGLPYDWRKNGPVNGPVGDWCQALRSHGVHVINLTAQFLAQRHIPAEDGKSYPVFLPNDTHWAPCGAQLAAEITANYIRNEQLLSPHNEETTQPAAKEIPISHQGDFADLMQSHGLTSLTTDTVAFSVDPAPVQEGTNIQLLGDSLTRIFSEDRSSYGDHLKARIGAHWDIIAPNAGVTTSRRIFARKDNIDEIDLVIWEVAEEFLALHSMWRPVPLNTEGTLQLWQDGLLIKASQPPGASTDPVAFEDPSNWDRLVGIRVSSDSNLTWKVSTSEQTQFTTRVRVGPVEAGVAQRATVTFRIVANGKELYRTGLVPRRDRHVLSEPITLPLPEAGKLNFSLITEVTEGTPPPWIDWVTPEIFRSKLNATAPLQSAVCSRDPLS